MIERLNINKYEGGLSVRSKLNTMFSELITGSEGSNAIWKKIQEILNSQEALEKLTEQQYEELKDQVLKSFDYTDVTAADLLTYINAINGGVAGFAGSTDYNPNIPQEKSATIIALGPGTYVYFLDENGESIVINGVQAFTVFYKAAGVTFWKYKTIDLSVVVDNNIDGGTAFTKYGGSKVIDGGNATR